MITKGNKVQFNFRQLNVPENDIECESFAVISGYSFLVYENKYYLIVHLDNHAYKIIDKCMIYSFETDEDEYLTNRCYQCCVTIELK